MKFVVTDQELENDYTPNTILVRVKVMSGDGVAYEKVDFGGFDLDKDHELLENFIETLDALLESFPQGRGGMREYSYQEEVPNFVAWFNEEFDGTLYTAGFVNPVSEEVFKEVCELRVKVEEFLQRNENWFDWPQDSTSADFFDTHGEADIQSYEVFYVDSSKKLLKVNIDYDG